MQFSKNVRKSVTADGAVMLDVVRGQMFRANPVGSSILQLLSERRTVSQIAQQLSSTYGVPIDTAESDVREFLASLKHHQLLETAHGEHPDCAAAALAGVE